MFFSRMEREGSKVIVSFFDCTQVSSRKKHRKAGRIQEAFLMVFCLEA